MQRETVLANIRVHMTFNEKTLAWFEKIKRLNLWFAVDHGMSFLSQFKGAWDKILVYTVETEVHKYFSNLGLPKDKLPHVKVLDSYRGSWVIEAHITMSASMGTAHAILVGISELPKIANGLTELKDRLKKEFSRKADRGAKNYIDAKTEELYLPKPPDKLIDCEFTIDALPLISLTPPPYPKTPFS